jgi:hypothetical protein
MIDLNLAKEIALKHINSNYQMQKKEDEISIVDDLTVEREWGWIFIYQSQRWIETRNRRYQVLGLCPIVIEKNDGSLHYLDEGINMEECIKKYENRRRLKV